MPANAARPSARALLVGVPVTSYRPGELGLLSGVLNDIDKMQTYLSARGFDVTVPTGDGLGCQEVAAAIGKLVTTTRAGDLSVIYLSGHGVRIPDIGGDEADGWDEAFVCSDGPIPDDWFRQQLWPCALDGAAFVVIVDACHSGSMVLALGEDERPPLEVTVRRPKGTLRAAGSAAAVRAETESLGLGLAGNVIRYAPEPASTASRVYYRLTLAACPDDKVAVDEASRGGAVTATMLDLLPAGDPAAATYRNLWSRVGTVIHQRYQQDGVGTPQIDSLGPDDRLLDARPFALPPF